MKILYFAKLKQLIGKSEYSLFIKKKKKIRDVIKELKEIDQKHASAFEEVKNIQFAVNCEYVDKDFYVTDKDELALFPPVTGG